MSPVAVQDQKTKAEPASINKKVQAFEPAKTASVSNLDASRLTVTLTETPATVPDSSHLVFGAIHTDHMLLVTFSPESGWSAPSIQPYGPLALDPMSSCFQYATNCFEGMKAYMGPDGRPRLFRPDMNMARMKRSVDRLALPPFNEQEVLKLIKRLVLVEKRWIPTAPGCSLYIRPTMIGTRAGFGVTASTHATLYVVLSPTGPYFPGPVRPISLWAEAKTQRAWPGGTGEFKLALNYAPCLKPQREVSQHGYDQILWLFGSDSHLGEVGQMNVFLLVLRDDGDYDLITPPLDGTILPGVTRDSMIRLARSHTPASPLPGLSPSVNLHVRERHISFSELLQYQADGKLKEFFGVGTAAVLVPINNVGYDGSDEGLKVEVSSGSFGEVAGALREEIVAIQEGRKTHEWSVPCDE